MLTLIYVVVSVFFFKKETIAMTGCFVRHGISEGWAKNLSFGIYLAEYFMFRMMEHAFMLHKLF